jgi:SAM-dependent methyltransferase
MSDHPAGVAWRAALALWAIPEPIRAAAPEDPFGFCAALFEPDRQAPAALSTTRARDALPVGGTVLDVGCGGGAAGLALVPPAAAVTGVDPDPGMVALFDRSCAQRAIAGRAVLGRWPDVADAVAPHDVVVSHHVVYNVAAIEDFLLALTARARHRVVLEVTRRHPQAELNELWRVLHGVVRPQTPGVEDLLAVLRDLGIDAEVSDAQRPAPQVAQPRDELVTEIRRRLCLPRDADGEIDRLLPADFRVPPPRVTCVWWAGRG